MEFTIAHIEMNDGAHVYITRKGSKEVIDTKSFPDRQRAIKFIKDAYPDSDIRTCTRFLG